MSSVIHKMFVPSNIDIVIQAMNGPYNWYKLWTFNYNQNKTQACLQPQSTLYWLVQNSDAYTQQGINLDALDMHISNKKFSPLVLDFETIENPNKHTQINEKDKSTTWPRFLLLYLKIHPRDRQYGGFPWWGSNVHTMRWGSFSDNFSKYRIVSIWKENLSQTFCFLQFV